MSPFPPTQSTRQHPREQRDYDAQSYYISSHGTLESSSGGGHHNVQSPSVHPLFRAKAVCVLTCKHCQSIVCQRGMKAILLADTRVELYSTDSPPTGRVQMVADDYMTRNCRCKIRDVACLCCGNVVGYHVTQPCDRCLEACNNGHFWMFHSDGVYAKERFDPHGGGRPLLWAYLPCADREEEEQLYEVFCR